MRLVRLPLAALALVAFTACSNDATGPQTEPASLAPAGPRYTGNMFGSGMKTDDSVHVATAVSDPGEITLGVE